MVLAVFTGIYLLLFHLPVWAGQKILFYRGIWLLLAAAVITAGLLGVVFRWWAGLTAATGLAAIITAAAINLAVFVIFPVSFDRSVSMYLLNNLNSCRTEAEMEKDLVDVYVQQNRAVRRRIEEQKATGTVTENNSCVSLTTGGKNFLKLSEIIKKVYGVK